MRRRAIHLSLTVLALSIARQELAAARANTKTARLELDDVHGLELPISRRAQVACGSATNGITAELRVSGKGAGDALWKAGPSFQIGPYTLHLERRHPDQIVGHVDGPSGVLDCVVRAQGAAHVLQVGRRTTEQILAVLRAHVLRRPEIEVSETEAKALAEAEQQLAAGEYESAAKALTTTSPRLDDYIQLRKADIHLLAGRVPTAYLYYRNLAALRPGSEPGIVAQIRAAALAHLLDGKVPDEALVKLASNGQLDGAARSALPELAELLLRAGRLTQVLDLARIHGEVLRALGEKALVLVLQRELIAEEPYRAATAFERGRGLLESHPERIGVALLAARAYLELGLPGEASSLLQGNIEAVRSPADEEELLRRLAEAFLEGGDAYRAHETASFYLSRYAGALLAPSVHRVRALVRIELGDQQGAEEDLARLPEAQRSALESLLDRSLPALRASDKQNASEGQPPVSRRVSERAPEPVALLAPRSEPR